MFGFRSVCVAVLSFSSLSFAQEEAAKATKPPLPWHMADVWWAFKEPTPHFESLDLEVTFDRDVPSDYNLYVAPCGLGSFNGINFYGGFQTNTNGWPAKDKHVREHIGKGAIFSRWGEGKLSVNQARGTSDTHYEAADYEGDFVSVRRPLAWTKGTYTWSLRATDTETVDGQDYTWVSCFVRSHETGESRFIGSLRFEGKDLTYGKRQAAFVEIYSTAKISDGKIPEVKVTFGYPRVNGKGPALQEASVIHPGPGEQSASPDVAKAAGEGSSVVVTVVPEFERTKAERRHKLEVKEPSN